MVGKCEDYPYSSYNDYLKKSDYLNEELCEIIFGVKKIDIEKFKNIHFLSNYYFMENIDMTEENMREIISEYEAKYGKTWDEIIKMREERRNIILDVKKKVMISNRKLAKYLNINRNTLNKIIKN